jgi:hypothetical protein
MSCENCNIIIRNVIGTPSSYKIRWTKLNDLGEVVYVNNGPITAQDIRDANLEIFAGGPGHPDLGQFWDGNTISIRFENFSNEDCYLDVPYSCEPATTTTQPVSDCCDGMIFAIKTTGTQDDQIAIAGLSTRGFAAGSFQQTIGADEFTYTVDSPGFGKLCYPDVNRDDTNLRTVGISWSIVLRNRFAQFVEADGSTIQTIPAPIGNIQMMRPWADPSVNETTYVAPDGTCFRGALNELSVGLTIWDEVV